MYIYDPPGAGMAVYPVPTTDVVNIEFSDMSEKRVLEDTANDSKIYSPPSKVLVYDSMNIMVADLTEKIQSSKNQVSLKYLGRGIYFMKSIYKDGFTETKRIIIE